MSDSKTTPTMPEMVTEFELGKTYGVLNDGEIVSIPMTCTRVDDDGSPHFHWAGISAEGDHVEGSNHYPADPPPFTGLFGGLMFAEAEWELADE